MTSHHTVTRFGLLGLSLVGLAVLWVITSHGILAQSPSIDGGAWQFDADSTGNTVEIEYTGLPSAGLGAADISIAFDSSVITVSACDTGDLDGACNPNAPDGPARAAGFKAPAITTEPVTLASLTIDCIGDPGSSSALTITVNELVDGTPGDAQPISASVQNGTVTCGVSETPVGPGPPQESPTATPGQLPDTGGPSGSSGSDWLILGGVASIMGIITLASLGFVQLRRRSQP